jgi:hypothetical protein
LITNEEVPLCLCKDKRAVRTVHCSDGRSARPVSSDATRRPPQCRKSSSPVQATRPIAPLPPHDRWSEKRRVRPTQAQDRFRSDILASGSTTPGGNSHGLSGIELDFFVAQGGCNRSVSLRTTSKCDFFRPLAPPISEWRSNAWTAKQVSGRRRFPHLRFANTVARLLPCLREQAHGQDTL